MTINERKTISITCNIKGCHENLRRQWAGEGLPSIAWYARVKDEILAKGWLKLAHYVWICPNHSGKRP